MSRMTITEKARKALKELDLTEYEVKAYVALLEQESRTASQISEYSGIPFSKIYEVLGSLERKGWVEIERGRPNRYYPKPPSLALEGTRIRIERTLRNNEKQIFDELQPMYERRGTRERPEIWIVRGEFNILSKVYETLGRAQEESLIAIPLITNEMVDLLSSRLIELSLRGVKTMIMTTKSIDDRTLKKMGFAEIRVRDQMFGGGVISDGREVILLLGEKENKVDLAISSDHIGLAKFAKNYFEYLWDSSKRVNTS
ncbi:MAG: TrmB family transcriptional regulator [Nitrososphaerales archaeon]|nr:TrmB family transcriptional regulator [Nitrososphaerales archaeon]